MEVFWSFRGMMQKNMRYALSLMAATLVLATGSMSSAQDGGAATSSKPFAFAAIGDMPYSPADAATKFPKLIQEINQDESVRFVLHTGDIKAGSERCDDALIQSRFNLFQLFNKAFIYTPGDNEWTDCHRVNNGGYNPIERLAFVRRTFFPNPNQSTGKRPIPVTAQSAVAGPFGKFVENTLFVRSRVVFSSVHVVGSNNNLAPWSGIDPTDSFANPRPDRLAEFKEREEAALAWLDYTFAKAKADNAAAVVVMIQANPGFELPDTDTNKAGFVRFNSKLKALSKDFGKPVLLVNGDDHYLVIDKPFERNDADANQIPYFTRIQVFGSVRVNWVKITVNPNTPSVFSFEEKIVK